MYLRLKSLFVLLTMTGFVSGDPTLSLNEAGFFVFTGQCEDVMGIDLASPAGALIPIPGGAKPDENANPFDIVLGNSPTGVTVAAFPGTSFKLDGSFTSQIGYNRAIIDPDFRAWWGDAQAEPIPKPLGVPGVIWGCEDCRSSLPFVSIAEDRTLVLNNFRDNVTSFTFSSADGVLTDLVLPETWHVTSRSDSEITFTNELGISAEDFGNLKVSWAANFDNKVFVSVILESGQSFGPFSLASVAVPEPASGTVLWVAILGLWHCRRRFRS